MSQNGRNMTADEFSAWMASRGVRVARGPATAPAPANTAAAPEATGELPTQPPAPPPTPPPPPPPPAAIPPSFFYPHFPKVKKQTGRRRGGRTPRPIHL